MPAMAVPDGYEPVDVGAGFSTVLGGLFIDRARARLGFRVARDQCNPVDTCHGGAIATFADAQIIAINPGSEDRSEHHPTISLSIDYLAPAFAGDWVESTVTVDRRTDSLLFTRATIRVADRTIARASAIYRIRRSLHQHPRGDGAPSIPQPSNDRSPA